ncbi:MAG: hypothetical protein IT300_04540 [Dehalococcoidia bacterium]|nr:hypothetical protein [Dehalococcoidia bacterium]
MQADQDLVLHLSVEGFSGPTWERMSRVLVEYGFAVIRAWIRSGLIYSKLKHHGLNVAPPALSSRTLSEDDVRELATDTVAEAILNFRDLLGEGRWNSGKGATLATYFVGNCLLRFPNVLRAWKRERIDFAALPLDSPGVPLPQVASAETVVMAELRFTDFRQQILSTPRLARDREVLRFLADGYSVPEICELTGLGRRQVSNRVFRIRKLLRIRGIEG